MDPCPLFVLSIKHNTDCLCEEEANHKADQYAGEALAVFGSKFPISGNGLSIYLVPSEKKNELILVTYWSKSKEPVMLPSE